MIKPLKIMKPEYYEKLFATNVIAGFELAKLLSNKKYLDKNGASFVFIASVMGVVGNAALVGYSATKGALIASVKSMAIELAPRKIRVNCISPGHIQDENYIFNWTSFWVGLKRSENYIFNWTSFWVGLRSCKFNFTGGTLMGGQVTFRNYIHL